MALMVFSLTFFSLLACHLGSIFIPFIQWRCLLLAYALQACHKSMTASEREESNNFLSTKHDIDNFRAMEANAKCHDDSFWNLCSVLIPNKNMLWSTKRLVERGRHINFKKKRWRIFFSNDAELKWRPAMTNRTICISHFSGDNNLVWERLNLTFAPFRTQYYKQTFIALEAAIQTNNARPHLHTEIIWRDK